MLSSRTSIFEKISITMAFIIVGFTLLFAFIIFYRIGGFENMGEMLFFIKRKIMFVAYKVYRLIF